MDIGPSTDTGAWLRVLADQVEKDEAPDFFIVTDLQDGQIDYTWRTMENCISLVGAVEIKLQELKDEIVESKITI